LSEDKIEVWRREDGGGKEDERRNKMTILSHEGMEGICFLLPKKASQDENKGIGSS
jgi:hypothetical protein